jgi:hypothetical protein
MYWNLLSELNPFLFSLLLVGLSCHLCNVWQQIYYLNKLFIFKDNSSPLQWKGGHIREVTCLEGNNLVAFYYLSESEIWPDKRGDLWWEWPYKRENTKYFTINPVQLPCKICWSQWIICLSVATQRGLYCS